MKGVGIVADAEMSTVGGGKSLHVAQAQTSALMLGGEVMLAFHFHHAVKGVIHGDDEVIADDAAVKGYLGRALGGLGTV